MSSDFDNVGQAAIGALSGAASGAKMGAMLGTMTIPGLGTIVGAKLGAIAGGLFGAITGATMDKESFMRSQMASHRADPQGKRFQPLYDAFKQ